QTASASITGGNTVSFSQVAQIQGATQIAANVSATRSDSVKSTVPVAVIVKDQNNTPVAGVIVTFAVTSGGGNLDVLVDTTDGTGVASRSWTLGTVSGAQVTAVTVTGLQGSPVTLTENSTAGNATQMALQSGDFQAGAVSQPLSAPHSVIVKDAYGNPKSGFTVNWALGVGGGSLPAASAISNASGVASLTPTLGAVPGVNSDTAKASVTGSPIAFTDSGFTVTTITIADNSFTPAGPTISHGGFVKFNWTGASSHNVTWDSGPTTPDNSLTMSSGTFTIRLTGIGTYGYHCTIHGTASTGMHAT